MAEHEYADPVGNRLVIHALTSRTVIVEIIEDDKEGEPAVSASVIMTAQDLEAAAEAACGICVSAELIGDVSNWKPTGLLPP